MTSPTGASAHDEPMAETPDGAMAENPTASALHAPADESHAPLLQPLQPAEPLNAASAQSLIGTNPGQIHPDIWAILDDLVDGKPPAECAVLIDRSTQWLLDHLRNAATKREIQRRAAYAGDLQALRARNRIVSLSEQSEAKTVALQAAIYIDKSAAAARLVNRGISGAPSGKNVIVVLNRRGNGKRAGRDDITVSVSDARGSVHLSAGMDDDEGDVIDADAMPVVTPALLREAVRAGLDGAAIGADDEIDPDDA